MKLHSLRRPSSKPPTKNQTVANPGVPTTSIAGQSPPVVPSGKGTLSTPPQGAGTAPKVPASLKTRTPGRRVVPPQARKLFDLLDLSEPEVKKLLSHRRLRERLLNEDFRVGLVEAETPIGASGGPTFLLRMDPGNAFLLLEALLKDAPDLACRCFARFSFDLLTNLMSNPKSTIDPHARTKTLWGWDDVVDSFKSKRELFGFEGRKAMTDHYVAAVLWALHSAVTPIDPKAPSNWTPTRQDWALFKTWLQACPDWMLDDVLRAVDGKTPAHAPLLARATDFQLAMNEAGKRELAQRVLRCLNLETQAAELRAKDPELFNALVSLGSKAIGELGRQVNAQGIVLHMLRSLVVSTPAVACRLLLCLPRDLVFNTLHAAPHDIRLMFEWFEPVSPGDLTLRHEVNKLGEEWASWIEEGSHAGSPAVLAACPSWVVRRVEPTMSAEGWFPPGKPGTTLASLLEVNESFKNAWNEAARYARELPRARQRLKDMGVPDHEVPSLLQDREVLNALCFPESLDGHAWGLVYDALCRTNHDYACQYLGLRAPDLPPDALPMMVAMGLSPSDAQALFSGAPGLPRVVAYSGPMKLSERRQLNMAGYDAWSVLCVVQVPLAGRFVAALDPDSLIGLINAMNHRLFEVSLSTWEEQYEKSPAGRDALHALRQSYTQAFQLALGNARNPQQSNGPNVAMQTLGTLLNAAPTWLVADLLKLLEQGDLKSFANDESFVKALSGARQRAPLPAASTQPVASRMGHFDPSDTVFLN